MNSSFMVNVDADALAAQAEAAGDVALIIVDPLDSHLGSVDSHKKAEVQAAIQRSLKRSKGCDVARSGSPI